MPSAIASIGALFCMLLMAAAAAAAPVNITSSTLIDTVLPVVTTHCNGPDERALAAILPVATDHGSHASGVVFAENRVLTAAHALQDASHYFVRVSGGFREAELLVLDRESDLAVLAVDTQGIAPLPLSALEPADQQTVWAVGYPRAQAMATSTGVFQRNREGALHTSASIDSGQSGGGLLACSNGSYQLLGMLRGYGAYLSGDHYVKLENHSVSVAATTIHQFLGSWQ
ncbi:MAG: serine protease [Granulosicoccus sp.]